MRLSSLLLPVDLPVRTRLFTPHERPRHVHFLLSGIASVVTTMESGEVIEVGLVGREGFAEKVHVLGSQPVTTECFMQVAGSALRMGISQFEAEFLRPSALLRRVHEYLQHDALVQGQITACNRLHEVEQRLARWLLMVQDREESRDVSITQEFLGEMLGVRRSSVNLAIGNLHKRGAIEYSRGCVVFKDRSRLMRSACECYGIIGNLYRNLYATAL